MKKAESINHPDYYGGEKNPYEALKVIIAWNLNFCLGNVLKYISRAEKKSNNSIEDLEKARFYLDYHITTLKKNNPTKSNEDKSKWYDCANCDALYLDQECTCNTKEMIK